MTTAMVIASGVGVIDRHPETVVILAGIKD